MKLEIDHKTSYDIEDENNAVVISNYELVATKSTKKEFAVKISCTYRLKLSSETVIPKEFMDIYTELNLQMNTWPYFREFVQSMIQKAGFPPLTLPFFKI